MTREVIGYIPYHGIPKSEISDENGIFGIAKEVPRNERAKIKQSCEGVHALAGELNKIMGDALK